MSADSVPRRGTRHPCWSLGRMLRNTATARPHVLNLPYNPPRWDVELPIYSLDVIADASVLSASSIGVLLEAMLGRLVEM